MNKVFWIILLLLLGCNIKLGMDFYTLQYKTLPNLSSAIDQQNQRIGNLYDQMVALQKQPNPPATATQNSTSTKANEAPAPHVYSEQQSILDQMQLIQAYLQQQQFSAGLEHIQQLKQRLMAQPLSQRLNQALIEALTRDQTAITQYLQQRNEQQQMIHQQLQMIGQAMQPKALDQAKDKWQWSNWLSISQANNVPDLQNRILHFKYMQLQLLLAEQALYAGQLQFYRAQIQRIIETLSTFPDPNNRRIIAQLQKVDGLSVINPPQLTALALVQGH